MRGNRKNVIGGIIGDIAGSVYEFDNYRGKDFDLFCDYHGRRCFPTDDSIMTLSICQALMDCDGEYRELPEKAVEAMQRVGRPYPYCGYGGRFYSWMYTDYPEPYYSFGNGAAMRISPVAYVADSIEQVRTLSEKVTRVSHDHPEGIKGAEATAVLTWMALDGWDKKYIRDKANEYYDLNFTIDMIRPSYQFNETCRDTVPEAIEAFLESTDFEDAIRTAISVGGDSDTLACITGSIAGAFYGVPEYLRQKAMSFLDTRLLNIYEEFCDVE